MSRAMVLMLDSLGIGSSTDAVHFNDVGADTFGHIAEAAALGNADTEGSRQGSLNIPNLLALGLAHASADSRGSWPADLPKVSPRAAWGYAVESSSGKDTPSGHWEMAGVPVNFEWGYFATTYPSFPEELTSELIKRADLPGVLGNCHASGTEIIKEFGLEHIRTGQPIVYTSGDSVFQIAAHEGHFGLEHLYEVCRIARQLVDQYHIGRVIARPFIGTNIDNFKRTENRRDYTTPPPEKTLLDHLVTASREVISVGKISDIFAHQGITKIVKASGNDALFTATVEEFSAAAEGSLVFTNFVDFDSLYGHRRDVAGYALALEEFDSRIGEITSILTGGDLVIMTADHGCDPTWAGHDHTREHVPVTVFGPNIGPTQLGVRHSFSDIGQTLAEHLQVTTLANGISFYSDLWGNEGER